MNWEIVIGLEAHAQLNTRSKMFSGASTAFGAAPNTQACAVDIALPGVLPVVNREAVAKAVRFGLAVNGNSAANINRRSIFARKNYFYPDLPKGYQISQYETPIVKGGSIDIVVDGRDKKIRLTRAHLEEDAGKSLHGLIENAMHDIPQSVTGIDLNRAGTPLLEIVSEPEMRSAHEAVAFAKALHEILTWRGICDGNMQEGSFRCDANVSVRPAGEEKLGTRCEIKNLNSFRFMEQAIEFEVRRQIEILEIGGRVEQETRLYDPERNETRSMRTKEEAHDYRYFPDPDLLPLVISEEMIEEARKTMPASREEKQKEFEKLGIPTHNAAMVTTYPAVADHFATTANSILETKLFSRAKLSEVLTSTANATVTSLMSHWGEALTEPPISPKDWARIQVLVGTGEISVRMAKEVLDAVVAREGDPDSIIAKRGLKQISDSGELERVCVQVIAANAQQVADYRGGKDKAFNSLVGQVMKLTKGKANPQQVTEILKRKLTG
ncbi:MAG TPA: Asp-tRNA(Asn)/Glu-tRNA(Gln) amidotransferase subunit GatB [Burkholderiales bacterium]